MGYPTKVLSIALSLILICPIVRGGDTELGSMLATGEIDRIRVNLNPWGPHLGSETVVAGDHPGIATLLSLIRHAEPSRGHKCANRGAIRLWMADGRMVAIGLLPGHSEGIYQFRLYENDKLAGVYSVRRDAFLAALEGLGVPIGDPAFAD